MKKIIRGRRGSREKILEETDRVDILSPERPSRSAFRRDWWKYLMALILIGAAAFLWAGPALTQSVQSTPEAEQEADPGQ